MGWRLAKSLVQLGNQINTAHPDRSRESDGSIGDQAHAARVSDHNPDKRGVVAAIDITHDPANGVDGHVLATQLTMDTRAKYVIFDGKIWKARTRQWEDYHGANAHRHHVHISVKPDNYNNAEPWALV
jgi:hypothetical protein